MARRSVIKKLSIGGAIALVLLVVLVAIAPMLISAGLGHGLIRNAIEGSLAPGSRADFQQLSVRWGGPQELRGLRIDDPTGEEVANVNVRFSPGLFALVFGSTAVQEAVVSSGTITAQMYEDGTTNIQRIMPEARPTRDEPSRPLAGLSETLLRLADIDLLLRDSATGETAAFRNIAGDMRYVPATATAPSQIIFEIAAMTEADGTLGDARLSGQSSNLFSREGAFTPQNAPMEVQLAVNSVPVPGMDMPTQLTTLLLTLTSENMAEHIAIEADAEAQVQDEPPSRFRAEIGVRVPFTPEGAFDLHPENITGTVRGERVPASLLQPMLAHTPIVVRRDVGSTIDVDVELAPDADGLASVRIVGERAELDLAAQHDAETGWWRGDRLVLNTPQAHPDLVRGFTQLTVDRPADVQIVMTSFGFPPIDPATDSRPLWQYAGTGVLRVNEPVALLFESEDDPEAMTRSIAIDLVEIEFDSPGLGQYLDLVGRMQVEGGQVRVQERITNLFDEAGEMDAFAANFVGELAIENLPSQTLAQWMPEQEEMIREVLGEQVSAMLRTTLEENILRADLSASGQQLSAQLTALRGPETLEITQTAAEFTLTPALVEFFQREMDDPIAILDPAAVRLELHSLVLHGSDPREYRWEDATVSGNLVVADLPAGNVPGLAEPVSIRDFSAAFQASLSRDPFAGEPEDVDAPLLSQIALEGTALLARYASAESIAALSYNITGTPRDEQMEFDGALAVREIDVQAAEFLLGREPGNFEQWLGRSGTLSAQFNAVGGRYEATVLSEMPRLQGTFAATYGDDLIGLRADSASLTLGAEALENLLAVQDEAATVRIPQDVPLTLALNAQLPLGLLTDEPYEAALLNVNADMRGGPLTMVTEGERTTLDNVVMTLSSETFSQHVDFRLILEGDVMDERATRVGGVNATGSVRQPVVADQLTAFEQALINLNASLEQAPTAFIDALLGMGGYLTATIGPHIDGTVTASELSRTAEDGGTLTIDLRSEYGWLRGTGTGRNGTLVVTDASAIEAELQMTPLLRDVVLARLNPLLGEVLLAEQPLSASFSPASIPLDGDVTKLSGEIRMTIGDVRLDQRSPMFAILAMADVREAGLVAHIEPVNITIDNGVISYDRFNLQIDRFEMPYSGQINLATRQVRLRTALPLAALRIRELERIAADAGDLEIPLVTRGTLGEPLALEIDPDFDVARLLLRYGIERGIGDLLRRR